MTVLQYFLETAGSMDHQHLLRQAVFFSSCHSDCTVLENREGWPQIFHDVGSLCISTKLLINFFLVKRTFQQELQVKETSGKRDQKGI